MYLRKFLALFVCGLFTLPTVMSAQATVTIGNVTDPFTAYGIDFDTSITVNQTNVWVGIDESNVSLLSDGSYDLEPYVGYFGEEGVLDSDDFTLAIDDAMEFSYQQKDSGSLVGTLFINSSVGTTSASRNGEFVIQKLRSSQHVTPGEYILNATLGGKTVKSVPICLPTFTSSIGKSIGNVSCSGQQPATQAQDNQSQSSPTDNTQPQVNTSNDNDFGPQLSDSPSGDSGSGQIEPVNNILSVRFQNNKQSVTETTATIVGNIILKVPGPIPVTLEIQYGPSPSQINKQVVVFDKSLVQGQPSEFSQTFTGLLPGDVVYFRFKDIIRNSASSLFSIQTKGGTPVGQTPGVYQLGETPEESPLSFDSQFLINDPFEDRGLVPCGNTLDDMCTFQDFLQLISNVIDFMLVLLVPAAAIATVVAGVHLILSRGNPEGRKKAKELFVRIAIAAIVIMAAWIIVATFYAVLGVEKNYIMLDIFK